MFAKTGRPLLVSDAIIVDEVGIESGVYGKYRLKSSYQPIFARQGSLLWPVAVEGLILPHLAGKPVSPDLFFDQVPPEDRLIIERMCRALHIHNHHNIGVDRLELYFNYDPGANSCRKSLGEIRFMARRLGEIGLDPRLLVCEITRAVAPDRDTLQQLAGEVRSLGARIAIDDFGAGHSTQERIDLVRPDIVKIDGAWFRTLCPEAATVRLLGSVVSGFQGRGARVLVEGIEDAAQLDVALHAGADLFQGYHLARPALAGTAFDETPLKVAEKLHESPKIVPLFG
jgi:EAL domain-containing protein (putative c-di-GMP-specific phosphodiesterase class I)